MKNAIIFLILTMAIIYSLLVSTALTAYALDICEIRFNPSKVILCSDSNTVDERTIKGQFKDAISSSNTSKIHFSSATPSRPIVRTMLAENKSMTKASVNEPHNVTITPLSSNLDYSKILKYDNNSFTLSNNDNATFEHSKNGTVTLNGNVSIWSRPIKHPINYIETTFRVTDIKNRYDNTAGIIWDDGQKQWYVFLRPNLLSIYNSIDGDLDRSSKITRSYKSDAERDNYVWHTLSIGFAKNITNVYLDHVIKMSIPGSPSGHVFHSNLKVGVKSYNVVAEFKPINVHYTISDTKGVIGNLRINDPNLKAEVIFNGHYLSQMAFLGPNDILVLEKDTGKVQRITNGKMLPQPLLQVPVSTKIERGLLGIAIAKNSTSNVTYVFLYFTQSGGGKVGDDVNAGIPPMDNRVYRYELANNKLINPKLLLKLPATPGPYHNGGKILIGPDRNLYIAIGDVSKVVNDYKGFVSESITKAQNFLNGTDPDGTGGILRITQDGKAVGKGILGNKFPTNLYYAYGIRNSFGMDFDPVRDNLWDTENGPNYGDEINLVKPGFNSGWAQEMGIWKPQGKYLESEGPIAKNPEHGLVTFGGKGKYAAPQFIWNQTVGPTALTFLNSTQLGKQYQNEMFVGDAHNGRIYHFKLNNNRTGLILGGSLADRIENIQDENNSTIFAQGGFKDVGILSPFVITDLKVGPDGYLYVLAVSLEEIASQPSDNQAEILRIVPK